MVKNLPANAGDNRFNSRVRKISWRRKWQPTPAFLPGISQGQSSLAGYSQMGQKEWDTTQWQHLQMLDEVHKLSQSWVSCVFLLYPPGGFSSPLLNFMVGMSQQGAHHCPSTAPFLLHLVVKAFSILLRKYLSPFEGSKKQPMAFTLEAGPLSGGSAQCRGETWAKTSVSPTEFRPYPPLEVSPVCGWGIPAQSSLKTFELRAWASTLGAFGGERWLKQLPPPTLNLSHSSTWTFQKTLSSPRKICMFSC